MRAIAVIAALTCSTASVSAADIELRAVRHNCDVVVPARIFVRSGNDVLSFTKDDPLVLRKVVLEQELGLLTVEPYKFLVSLPRKQ